MNGFWPSPSGLLRTPTMLRPLKITSRGPACVTSSRLSWRRTWAMYQRLLYETHCHTPLCRHAVGTPQEYAQHAFERNLKGITFTDHNPMPMAYAAPFRMSMEELDQYVEMVAA